MLLIAPTSFFVGANANAHLCLTNGDSKAPGAKSFQDHYQTCQRRICTEGDCLVPYRPVVLKLIKSFFHIQLGLMPRMHKRHADTFATLASKIDVPDETIDLSIIKRTLRPRLEIALSRFPSTVVVANKLF